VRHGAHWGVRVHQVYGIDIDSILAQINSVMGTAPFQLLSSPEGQALVQRAGNSTTVASLESLPLLVNGTVEEVRAWGAAGAQGLLCGASHTRYLACRHGEVHSSGVQALGLHASMRVVLGCSHPLSGPLLTTLERGGQGTCRGFRQAAK
jgi:hypothetical protein